MGNFTWSYQAPNDYRVFQGSFSYTDTTTVKAVDDTFTVTTPTSSIAISSNISGNVRYMVTTRRATYTDASGTSRTGYFYNSSTGVWSSSWVSQGTSVSIPNVDKSYSTSTYFSSSNPTEAYKEFSFYWAGNQLHGSNLYFNESNIVGAGPIDLYGVGKVRVYLDVPPTFDVSPMAFDKGYKYTGLTTASVTVSNCTAYYGGDISSATLTIGSKTETISVNGGSGTISMLLSEAGSFTPTVTVTDSRGQTSTQELTAITVNGYRLPEITSLDVERAKLVTGTSNYKMDDEGTYPVIKATFTYTNAVANLIKPAVEINSANIDSLTTWYTGWNPTTGVLSGAVNWTNYNPGSPVTLYGLVNSTISTESSAPVSVTPKDNTTNGIGTKSNTMLSQAFYTIDFLAGGHGIAFGQPATEEGFHCVMPAYFQDMTAQEVDDFVESIGGGGDPIADVVIEQGTSGIWTYRKWNSGIAECWGQTASTSKSVGTSYGSGFYAPMDTISFPSGLFTSINFTNVTVFDSGAIGTWFEISGLTTTEVKGYLWGIRSNTANFRYEIHAYGRWK